MFDTKSRQRLELERFALESMKFYNDGQIAVIFITLDMMESSGAEEGDTEGLSAIPRQIEGVRIGITFREKEKGNFKISMRSSGDIDVSALCKHFGGGGHKAAAGCSITGDINEIEKNVVSLAGTAL